MARKKVVDLNADTTISFDEPGQQLEGYYLGFKEVATSFGPSKLHILQNDKGSVGAWGSAQLDAKLKTVKPGTMVYVTFIKKVKIPKGTQKLFDVEFDDELFIDVGNTTVNYSNEPSEESEEYQALADPGSDEPADVDPDDSISEDDEDSDVPAPSEKVTAAPRTKGTPTQTTAERKAAAAALLNKVRPGNGAKRAS